MLIGAAAALDPTGADELVGAELVELLEEVLVLVELPPELVLEAPVDEPPPHPARAAAIATHMSDIPHRAWRMSLPRTAALLSVSVGIAAALGCRRQPDRMRAPALPPASGTLTVYKSDGR